MVEQGGVVVEHSSSSSCRWAFCFSNCWKCCRTKKAPVAFFASCQRATCNMPGKDRFTLAQLKLTEFELGLAAIPAFGSQTRCACGIHLSQTIGRNVKPNDSQK